MATLKLKEVLNDESGVVKKLIFDTPLSKKNIVVETVLYQYEDRVVICFSTQFGCPVGCKFCGTGNKFGENLSASNMFTQIGIALNMVDGYEEGNKTNMKIQLMPMSMGEPMLNWRAVHEVAVNYLKMGFYFFVSTVGIDKPRVLGDFLSLGFAYKKFGLQFSLHNPYNFDRLHLFRNKTLPYMSVTQLEEFGELFRQVSGNKAYYNLIVTGKEDSMYAVRLGLVVGKNHLTCSVLCDTTKMAKGDAEVVRKFMSIMTEFVPDIDMSMFDPAGQDTIGGGCGQLLYTQDALYKHGNRN